MGGALPGSAQSDYGVIRGKPGNADVRVTPAGGFKRVLSFVAGKVSADSGAGVKATRSADGWSMSTITSTTGFRTP